MPDLDIRTNVSLQPFNTLALPGAAEYFCTANTAEQIQEALAFARRRRLAVTPVGAGSNVVLAGDLPGLTLSMASRGIEVIEETGDAVKVQITAGEDWHNLVGYTLARGWYGLENLALIPGRVGAAPIQNIGAYGVELRDRFVRLEAVDIATGEVLSMDTGQCRFGYRDSIFKHALRDAVVITSVTLALSRVPDPCLDYPELARALADAPAVTPKAVAEAVCRLRRAKLPDPEERPNAGSFFKNPVVGADRLEALRRDYPAMPFFPLAEGGKIPAAWLIEQCGWKGKSRGAVGCHERQPLVLVNRGGATGADVLSLARQIAEDVSRRFDIDLEIEPRVLGDAGFRH